MAAYLRARLWDRGVGSFRETISTIHPFYFGGSFFFD